MESMYKGINGPTGNDPNQSVKNRLAGSPMETTENTLRDSLVVHKQAKDLLQSILEVLKGQGGQQQRQQGAQQVANQIPGGPQGGSPASNSADDRTQAAKSVNASRDNTPPAQSKPSAPASFAMSRVPLDFSRRI
jgi:cell division protein FtsN